MPEPAPGELTRLLHRHAAGSQEAFDELVALSYDRLHQLARQQLRRSRPSQTLDTAALVHEVYLRLAGEVDVQWQDRSHFYAVLSRAMRFVVVDHARRRSAEKRGGGASPLTLETDRLGIGSDAETVLAVHSALDQLAALDSRLAGIVEARFFAGMTEAEIAASLHVSTRTVQRDWRRARAWLLRLLGAATPADVSI